MTARAASLPAALDAHLFKIEAPFALPLLHETIGKTNWSRVIESDDSAKVRILKRLLNMFCRGPDGPLSVPRRAVKDSGVDSGALREMRASHRLKCQRGRT